MKPRAIHQLSISAARGDAIGNERDGLATESVVESLFAQPARHRRGSMTALRKHGGTA